MELRLRVEQRDSIMKRGDLLRSQQETFLMLPVADKQTHRRPLLSRPHAGAASGRNGFHTHLGLDDNLSARLRFPLRKAPVSFAESSARCSEPFANSAFAASSPTAFQPCSCGKELASYCTSQRISSSTLAANVTAGNVSRVTAMRTERFMTYASISSRRLRTSYLVLANAVNAASSRVASGAVRSSRIRYRCVNDWPAART